MTPLKPFSTRRLRTPPPEFEKIFIEFGWPKVNHMYGKRAAYRFYLALGAERLKAARKKYILAGCKSTGRGK